jgi:CRISPR-associated protein Cmr2
MKHVLAISIGPVQDFIKAARKTRDLWCASTLLSDISRASAKAVESAGGTLIFPATIDSGSIPNKIVAEIPDNIAPGDVAAKAHAAAKEYWKSKADATLEIIRKKTGADLIDEKAYWEQIDTVLEFNAAWSPIGDMGYEDARQKAERLLAGRKQLRDFVQPEHAVGRPKSMLDGGRETVFKPELTSEVLTRLQIKKTEQLDAVSLVKRLSEQKRFVSLSRVAADPWLRELDRQGVLQPLKDLAAELGKVDDVAVNRFESSDFPQYSAFPFDTQLFYDADNPQASESPEAAKLFAEGMRLLKPKRPTPYVAVLVADGDKMGAHISTLTSADGHRKLSETLVDFAQDAGRIVREHQGALIYAGGDDVMAFLPLDKAIRCASELNSAFGKRLNPVAGEATLSVGIAIVHFQTRLDLALDRARAAEKAAKVKRASLAIALHTRSAGTQSVTISEEWKDTPYDKWATAIEYLSSGNVPDGLPYKLRNLADEFAQVSEDAVRVALAKEIAQVLRHSRRSTGDLLKIDTVQKPLKEIFGSNVESLRLGVNRLIIARHLVRVAGEASR